MTRTLQQLEPYLQGHWTFENDFKDHSQNSNDGTPTAIEWKPTSRGLKPEFDGSSSFVDCGNHSSLDIPTEYTVSTYIKISEYSDAGKAGTILKKGTGNPSFVNYLIYIDENSVDCYVGKSDNSGSVTRSFGNLQINRVYHLLFTFHNTDGFTCYLDGILISSIGTGFDAATSSENLIFADTWSTNVRFNGIIDDTRIYNTTLTADEALNLYNSTKYAHGIIPAERSYTHQLGIKPEDGLVLGFDGHTKNADRTFTDMSGESNHGTNVGTSRNVGYFGEVRSFDGVNDYVDILTPPITGSQDRTIIAWVKTSTHTRDIVSWGNDAAEEEFRLGLNADGKFFFGVNTGYALFTTVVTDNEINCIGIVLNGTKTDNVTGYFDGELDTRSGLVSKTVNTANANGAIGRKDSTADRYFDGNIYKVLIYNRVLSLAEIKSHFNKLATLSLFHISFKDYPDNEDVSYIDNESIPYSTMKVGSNGTFKVDDDQLVCSENISTLTLRNNHEFDGSEYITIDIGGTKYNGTGTITQGTVTVSISQGSRFITVAMSDTDVLNSIDIQFRVEAS